MDAVLKMRNCDTKKWNLVDAELIGGRDIIDFMSDDFSRLILAIDSNTTSKQTVYVSNNDKDVDTYSKRVIGTDKHGMDIYAVSWSSQELEKLFKASVVPKPVAAVFPDAKIVETKTVT